MVLETNNHSVFKLQYYLIMTIKYRHKIITKDISNQLQEHFERIGQSYKITVGGVPLSVLKQCVLSQGQNK